MSPLTRAQAKAFRQRWQLVNAAEIEELRKTSMVEKLRQTAVLMASMRDLEQGDGSDRDEEEVRECWRRLRELYHG